MKIGSKKLHLSFLRKVYSSYFFRELVLREDQKSNEHHILNSLNCGSVLFLYQYGSRKILTLKVVGDDDHLFYFCISRIISRNVCGYLPLKQPYSWTGWRHYHEEEK